MRKKYFYCIVIFAATTALFGCKSVFGGGSVAFSLPEWDESFGVGLEYWLIKTSDGSGEKSVLAGNVSRSVSLEVDFEKVTAIVAYPITNIDADADSPFFKPAGCIYPYQDAISYVQGFPSEILREFYAANAHFSPSEISAAAKQFNWQKLTQTVEAKSEEAERNFEEAAQKNIQENAASVSGSLTAHNSESTTFYNPWNCDHDAIFSGIQNGSFSASYLNQTKSNITSITLADLKSASNSERLFGCASLLGSYIPENAMEGLFVLPYNEQREFLSISNESIYEIFVTFLKKEKKIVLAINSIPL